MAMQSRIGIIGGGVSGIAAAKHLSKHEPVVFEATDSIGGVWKHCTYKSTRLQTPRSDYEFSDFPWPQTQRDNNGTNSFPSYQEVLDYLYSYANHFDVLKFVKFNSKVVEIRFIGEQHHGTGGYGCLLPGRPVWQVGVKTTTGCETVEWYTFELLVICIGKYGDIPAIPEFPQDKGPEIFKGNVLHTLDYCKLNEEESVQLLKGKKVIIFGNKKSAIDIAIECAEANRGPEGQPCTMVMRTLHWTLPNYSIWGIPFYMFYSTRASQFLHERPNQGLLGSLIRIVLSPLRWVASKIIESYLTWNLPLKKYGLKPNHSFEEDFVSCQFSILPENFFSEADKKKIVFKRLISKWWFWEGGVQFEDGLKLDADVVLLATGYDGMKKLEAIIPDPFRSLLQFPSSVMPLYRGTINPLIPNMAFIGYVESSSNLLTSEIRCKWLSRLADDQFILPSIEKMIAQTKKEMEIIKRKTRFYKRSCVSAFSMNHRDEICQEMGWKSRRKKNWIAEAFSPYHSCDYKEEKNNTSHDKYNFS